MSLTLNNYIAVNAKVIKANYACAAKHGLLTQTGFTSVRLSANDYIKQTKEHMVNMFPGVKNEIIINDFLLKVIG
jgi:hypothetical protein